jgi:hypothetical protein
VDITHVAYADDFAPQVLLTACNFNSVFVPQLSDQIAAVNPFRNFHCRKAA